MNNKKLIRLTESDLHRIVKESVQRILKESYWSKRDPYNSRRYHEFSSDEAKKLHDYDPKDLPAWHEFNATGTWHKYRQADGRDDTSWDSLKDYEDRHPIDPSPEDKEYQINRSWDELAYNNKSKNGRVYNPFNWDDRDYWDTNLNTYDTSKDGWGLDTNDAKKIRPTWRQSKNAGRSDVEQTEYYKPQSMHDVHKDYNRH